MEGKELVNLILGNISNSLVNMKEEPTEERINIEKDIIHDMLIRYIKKLSGKEVILYDIKAETEDYDILNLLSKIKTSLLFMDAANYVGISLYKELIKEQYIKILDEVDEYANSLNKKKTR